VGITDDVRGLYTDRHASYDRFIRAVRYPQGLRAFMRASPLLRPDLAILDAGCGTGALTLAVRAALAERGLAPRRFQAFDLTPAMLDRLRRSLAVRGIADVEFAETDVLALDMQLPAAWRDYDLVVSASMLEYVPTTRLVEALAALRARLRPGGTFVLFMTRRNVLTRWLIGRWWESNLYTESELEAALHAAGFTAVTRRRFPLTAAYLAAWGLVVEGRRPA
jgi:SAM-dependent methyltransferase